jgi:hypothetical protein
MPPGFDAALSFEYKDLLFLAMQMRSHLQIFTLTLIAGYTRVMCGGVKLG